MCDLRCVEQVESTAGSAAFQHVRPQQPQVVISRPGNAVVQAVLPQIVPQGAAALDVHRDEPYRAGVGPLADAPNLFCCPHQAWYSPESRAEMRRKGAEAARRPIA